VRTGTNPDSRNPYPSSRHHVRLTARKLVYDSLHHVHQFSNEAQRIHRQGSQFALWLAPMAMRSRGFSVYLLGHLLLTGCATGVDSGDLSPVVSKAGNGDSPDASTSEDAGDIDAHSQAGNTSSGGAGTFPDAASAGQAGSNAGTGGTGGANGTGGTTSGTAGDSGTGGSSGSGTSGNGSMGSGGSGQECVPSSTEQQGPCAQCGTQIRTCQTNGTWGPSVCTNQGECEVNEQSSETCGNCGTKTRICSSTCSWGAFGACSNEGVCAPTTSQDSASCDYCSEQVCTNTCSWGACELKPTSTCEWKNGSSYQCCGTGMWQFCSKATCGWFPCQAAPAGTCQ
jgi:hypothetical protein